MMGKFVLYILTFILIPSALFADCGVRSIQLSKGWWNDDLSDNDLLFTSQSTQQDLANKYDEQKKKIPAGAAYMVSFSTTRGSVYMCGHGCDKGTLVLAHSGWRFKNANISGDVLYKCDGIIDKEWVAYGLPVCTANNLKSANINNATNHDIYVNGNGFCKMSRELLQKKEKCKQANGSKNLMSFHKTGDVMAWWDDKTGICECREFLLNGFSGTASWQTSMNYVWNGTACVGSGQKTQQSAQYAQQNTNTCKLKDNTVLAIGKAKKLNGADCAKYVDDKYIMEKENGTTFEVVCRSGAIAVCKATSCKHEYTVDNGTGKCIKNKSEQKTSATGTKKSTTSNVITKSTNKPDKNTNTAIEPDATTDDEQSSAEPKETKEEIVQFTCDNNALAQVTTWRDTYSDVSDIAGFANSLIQYCDGDDADAFGFDTRYNNLAQMVKLHQQSLQTADSLRKNIALMADNLNSFNFEKSHWKTASGNFNGARLASDSIAGVVLGTIGGAVTSNVIKKNQTKHGFEDIRCVIGGQTVADYADDFVVGQ